MTPDRLDELIRNNLAAAPTRDSVERVMAGVFARLDLPQSAPWWRRWRDSLSVLPPPLPLMLRQSLVPVGLALLLGVWAGQALHPARQHHQPTATIAGLLTAPSLLPTGYQ